jgi:anti-sigma B factor antagonist
VLSTRAQIVAPFGVSRDLREGFIRVVVRGDLDLFAAPLLEGELASLERGSDPVVVDLSDLSIKDPSGLRPLARARNRAGARGRQFSIVGCRPAVRKVFELTGLTDMLGEAVPTPWEANTGG